MTLSKIIKTDIFIYVILIIIYGINKLYLRPKFGNTFILGKIVGSLPNFIGAFMFSLLPFGKFINKKYSIYFSALIVFLLLTSEEIFPFFTASKTFDYFDILASGIGVILAVIYFKYSNPELKMKKFNKQRI